MDKRKIEEIEFRGKRIDTDNWVYGYAVYDEEVDGASIVPFDFMRKYKYMKIYGVKPKTVGQFTGLNDDTEWDELTQDEQELWICKGNTKDNWEGRRVYEDDIIEISWGDTYKSNGVVEYHNKILEVGWEHDETLFVGFIMHHISENEDWYKPICHLGTIKKVGNIHDDDIEIFIKGDENEDNSQ